MRAPQRLHGLTLDAAVCAGPYPPQGFWTIAEGALGNGDCFGLYWPLGCEGETPVVCEMFHDEGRMVFSQSSLDVFAQWLDINHVLDEQAWDDESWDPRAHDVPNVDSPLPLIERAQLHVQAGEPSEAIELLQAACRRFPELQPAWTMLAVQHRRLGQHEAAVDAARAAILANWAFGIPDPSVLRLLRAAEAGNDPVLAMVQQMEFAFGGAKTNPDYAAMQVCIDRCWEAGDHLAALRLTQNRCYALRGETVSFQQREGFDLASWQHDVVAKCRSALRDDRQGM